VERLLPGRLGSRFRWLAVSSWVADLGDGFALAAGPLLIASQSRHPTLVALGVLLQRLPWLLFGLLSGVTADRLNRVPLAAMVELVLVCARQRMWRNAKRNRPVAQIAESAAGVRAPARTSCYGQPSGGSILLAADKAARRGTSSFPPDCPPDRFGFRYHSGVCL
jgi:hypothetical protein